MLLLISCAFTTSTSPAMLACFSPLTWEQSCQRFVFPLSRSVLTFLLSERYVLPRCASPGRVLQYLSTCRSRSTYRLTSASLCIVSVQIGKLTSWCSHSP